jgi:hypothetical protein
MSRSHVLTVCAAALLLLLAPSPTPAQLPEMKIDAVGSIDYARGPSVVQVGSWVKYRVKARSELGATDDYVVTVLIPGEEEWWGEDCFWVETWTQPVGKAPTAAATLMSYAIFADSMPQRYVQFYQRKTIVALGESDEPIEQVYKLPTSALRRRTPLSPGLFWDVDTLGTDTVRTPKGDYFCTKVSILQGSSLTSQSADSSKYQENRDTRVAYRTPEVPVTGIAREEIELGFYERTWLTGRSQESNPMVVLDHAEGVVELLDFGTGGVEAVLVPKNRRHSLAELRAERARREKPDEH